MTEDARAMWRAVGERAATVARDLARLVVPVECPGCDAPDVRWCDDCVAPWWEPPARCEQGAARLNRASGSLPTSSITSLESSAHAMVAAWKDGGRRDLDTFFATAMARAVASIAETLPERVVFVPAPARPSSTRRRGVDLPAMLAKAAARGAREAGLEANAVVALGIGAGQSRGESVRGRWRGTDRSVRVLRSVPAGSEIVLVDDVVTTGATLAACRAAIERPLTPVVGAVVLAHAKAPGWISTQDMAATRRRVYGE